MSADKDGLFNAENITNCKTVCLTLGPYRNLTTLTAAVLFLHPNCQVLNHAGDRIFGNNEVNFLINYSRNKFDNFIEFATKISSGGKRGDYGGSITLAHAFDSRYPLKEIFQKSGQNMVKNRIDCLFWKESLRISNFIREYQVDLQLIFNKEERLRFLMPIRNPLDCAKSNLKTGHAYRFANVNRSSSIEEVLLAVLNEIHWFARYKEMFPNRFFYFFEHSISRNMLEDLTKFLMLDKDETWLRNAESVMISKSTYEYDKILIDYYQENVERLFSDLPDLKEQLLQFISGK
jgi:hypothetical protein